MSGPSRRTFLKAGAATAAGMTFGRQLWAWAGGEAPFGPLQDDLLLRLPEGFDYTIVAETGLPLTEGRAPYPRPNFPDLNVAFPQSNGSVVLASSHEVPPQFPLITPAPGEEYDRVAGGAVSSVHLDADLRFQEGAYHAGGMLMNCSGSGTPWGTVLTGEEATDDFEQPHGFVWEVDLSHHTKTRLDGMGRFDHETAVVDDHTGIVYLTEDSGDDSLLYRFIPDTAGALAGGGVLEAYAASVNGGPPGWVTIDDPLGEDGQSPAGQGVAKGATTFSRLEGGRFDPFDRRWFYFAETEDPGGCGRLWRLNVDTGTLEMWADGSGDTAMCMPDNLAFDAAGNVFVCEDDGLAGAENPNQVLFVDRHSGEVHVFAETVHYWETPDPPGNVADEPTGPEFWHRADGSSVLFLNLQRAAPTAGLTLAITGPFAGPIAGAHGRARAPRGPAPAEASLLTGNAAWLPSLGTMSVAAAAGLVNLRRRGRVEQIPADLEDASQEF